MSFFSCLRVETGRLFRSKSAWICMVLCVCAPLAGYAFYFPAGQVTVSARLVANPALTGGLAGAVLFALLTLFELNRVHKSRTEALTDALVSPLVLNAARLLAVLEAALASALLAAVLYLPYTVYRMGHIFRLADYLKMYFLIMLPSMLLAVLAAASFYQFLRRVDLSAVLFMIFLIFSLSGWLADNYILRWVNPIVPTLSDDFSNAQVFRMALYNRLVWFALLGGFWLLSLLCVRKYSRGLFGSLAVNGRRFYLPVLAAALAVSGCYAYKAQPYVDHSPLEPVWLEASPYEDMLLVDTAMEVMIDTSKGTLSGMADYTVENNSAQERECRLRINPGYTVENITANGEKVTFRDLQDDTDHYKHIVFTLPADQEIKVAVAYGGMPQLWSIMRSYYAGNHIGDEYVELKQTDLAPLPETLTLDENAQITGRITLPENFMPITTGERAELLSENGNGTKTWLARDNGSGLTLYAGDYVMTELEGCGMPIEFYYSRKHQANMESLGAKQIMEDTIAYCTARYGSLPFTSDRPLKIVQISAYLSGGGAFRNFSVMGEVFFSDTNLADREKGASGAEVLAHEIVHQWWGLSAQCIDMQNADWTDEGLTVYTTYRMMKDKYGEEYAQKNYVDVWKQSVQHQNLNFYNRHPEYLDILPEKYAVNLRAGNSGTGMYSTMPLKIYEAAQRVGGEEKMDAILSQLYQNGGTEMPPFITYKDFLNACGLSEEDLNLE